MLKAIGLIPLEKNRSKNLKYKFKKQTKQTNKQLQFREELADTTTIQLTIQLFSADSQRQHFEQDEGVNLD